MNRKRVFRSALMVTALVAGLVVIGPDVQAATEVRFTAAGDYGARTATDLVLRKVAELDPDAHLALGDLAYGDAVPETAWCNYVKARVGEGFPFQLISGNHESLDNPDGAINNFSSCLPNQVPGVVGTYGREYYMDFPKDAPLVRVIQASPWLTFESGRWDYLQGDAHYNWLSAAIDEGRAKGAQWIIVTSHYPCQSVGVNGCSNSDFYKLMASKKVDMVLHGHEHAYMRTHQLRSGVSGCTTIPVGSFDADCVADSDSAFTAGQGTVFATVGTGGTPLRDVNPADPEAPFFAAYSGLNQNATYGLLDFRVTDTQITAQFVPTSGGNFTDAFTITKGAPPVNQSPVAAFASQVSNLSATVDGSSSADPDGTIAGYAWDFGDGFTTTGATPLAHAYALAGTYVISLTVTDNEGATNTTTRSVSVTDPVPVNELARDGFSRTVATGWGTAEVGGSWTTSLASVFAVNGSAGTITSALGTSRSAYLRSVSSNASDMALSLLVDKVPLGGGSSVYLSGRSVIGAGDYQSIVRLRADGQVRVRLGRTNSAGTETGMAAEIFVAGLTYTAGDKILSRMQVTGTSPTTVRVKLWKAGTTEPAAWTLTATDSTANLQVAGSVGVATYLSGTATNAPVKLSVDDLVVIRP